MPTPFGPDPEGNALVGCCLLWLVGFVPLLVALDKWHMDGWLGVLALVAYFALPRAVHWLVYERGGP
jgi:hypothetical protein